MDDYGPVVNGLEQDIDQVEEAVFSSERTNPTERIYYLKREVIEFHRATAPLLNPLNHLASRTIPHVHEDVQEYFRDVGERAAKRGHAPDLGLGGDCGGADDDCRYLRYELQEHAGARFHVRISCGARGHGFGVLRALLLLQTSQLVVRAFWFLNSLRGWGRATDQSE